MLDAHAPIAAPPTLQRSRGAASVRLGPGAGRAALRGLVQSGSARAFLPRVHGGPVEVYFLNTSGGLTGGDRLSLARAGVAIDTRAGTTKGSINLMPLAYTSIAWLKRCPDKSSMREPACAQPSLR